MYTPLNTPYFGTIVPIAGIDVSLNSVLNVGWHILLPYTLFGVGLMVYSQARLKMGERQLRRTEVLEDESV